MPLFSRDDPSQAFVPPDDKRPLQGSSLLLLISPNGNFSAATLKSDDDQAVVNGLIPLHLYNNEPIASVNINILSHATNLSEELLQIDSADMDQLDAVTDQIPESPPPLESNEAPTEADPLQFDSSLQNGLPELTSDELNIDPPVITPLLPSDPKDMSLQIVSEFSPMLPSVTQADTAQPFLPAYNPPGSTELNPDSQASLIPQPSPSTTSSLVLYSLAAFILTLTLLLALKPLFLASGSWLASHRSAFSTRGGQGVDNRAAIFSPGDYSLLP